MSSADENLTLSQIRPFRDKKKSDDGFALPFSVNPIIVKLMFGFSKINVFNSVAA